MKQEKKGNNNNGNKVELSENQNLINNEGKNE